MPNALTMVVAGMLPVAMGMALPLRVCTVSTCGRNGGQAFLEALQTLTEGEDLNVIPSGCLSICRGVCVAGGPPERKQSLPLKIETGDAISAFDSAAAFLEESCGVDAKEIAQTLLAAARGDEALVAGEFAAAAAQFTMAIESPIAIALKAELADATPGDLAPPVFRLQGRAAAEEEERVTPRRVRWLYKALVGRCIAQLELSEAESALEDACSATEVCSLAGGGWYCLRDAAKSSKNMALANKAEAELTRLGFALDMEGPVPTDAERQALEQAAAEEEREQLAAQQRARQMMEQREREAAAKAEAKRVAAAAAAAAEEEAAEAARIEAEWNTPEAVAARQLAVSVDALRASVEAARKRPDPEKLVDQYKWSGSARRESILSGHVTLLSTLSAEAQAAAAAGVTSKELDEAKAALEEMEATKQALEAM